MSSAAFIMIKRCAHNSHLGSTLDHWLGSDNHKSTQSLQTIEHHSEICCASPCFRDGKFCISLDPGIWLACWKGPARRPQPQSRLMTMMSGERWLVHTPMARTLHFGLRRGYIAWSYCEIGIFIVLSSARKADKLVDATMFLGSGPCDKANARLECNLLV